MIRKRAQLIDGGLTHSQDGLVVYEKKSLVKEDPKPKPKVTQQQASAPGDEAGAGKTKNKNKNKKKDKTVAWVNREECYCMGVQHPCLGNCLSCGKIICELEGNDLPCLFCGVMFSAMVRSTASGDKSLNDAVSRKDALLAYEKSSVARSMIYDDQGDYFNTDSQWMSKDEKKRVKEKEEKMREDKQRRKHAMKITLDIFGRRIIMSEEEASASSESIYQPFNLEELMPKKKEEVKDFDATSTKDFMKPSYIKTKVADPKKNDKKKEAGPVRSLASRVQDSYFDADVGGEEAGEERQDQEESNHNGSGSFEASGIFYNHSFVPQTPWKQGKAAMAMVNANDAKYVAPKNAAAAGTVLNFQFPVATVEAVGQVLKSAPAHLVAVCLDLSQHDQVDENCNTLAKSHGVLVNQVIALRPENSKIEIWVKPFHHALRKDYAVCRKYWNELNENLRKYVVVVLSSSGKEQHLVTKEDMNQVRAFFGPKRGLVLIDDGVTDLPFRPFSGRQHGLGLKGMFCVCDSNLSLPATQLAISGALEFFRDDLRYDFVDVLKRILVGSVKLTAREAQSLLEMLHVSPANLRSAGENEALFQQLKSKRRLDELGECLQTLRRSKNLKAWLHGDVKTMETILFKPVEDMLFESRKALIMKEENLSRKQRREKIQQLQLVRSGI
jgi:hypothetical protein